MKVKKLGKNTLWWIIIFASLLVFGVIISAVHIRHQNAFNAQAAIYRQEIIDQSPISKADGLRDVYIVDLDDKFSFNIVLNSIPRKYDFDSYGADYAQIVSDILGGSTAKFHDLTVSYEDSDGNLNTWSTDDLVSYFLSDGKNVETHSLFND